MDRWTDGTQMVEDNVMGGWGEGGGREGVVVVLRLVLKLEGREGGTGTQGSRV